MDATLARPSDKACSCVAPSTRGTLRHGSRTLTRQENQHLAGEAAARVGESRGSRESAHSCTSKRRTSHLEAALVAAVSKPDVKAYRVLLRMRAAVD